MDILGNRNLREGNASNVLHHSGDPTETVVLPGKEMAKLLPQLTKRRNVQDISCTFVHCIL